MFCSISEQPFCTVWTSLCVGFFWDFHRFYHASDCSIVCFFDDFRKEWIFASHCLVSVKHTIPYFLGVQNIDNLHGPEEVKGTLLEHHIRHHFRIISAKRQKESVQRPLKRDSFWYPPTEAASVQISPKWESLWYPRKTLHTEKTYVLLKQNYSFFQPGGFWEGSF